MFPSLWSGKTKHESRKGPVAERATTLAAPPRGQRAVGSRASASPSPCPSGPPGRSKDRWRNIRYSEVAEERGLERRSEPRRDAPVVGEILPFGCIVQPKKVITDAGTGDVWLQMEDGHFALAECAGTGVVNCVKMEGLEAKKGRLPQSATKGQVFPVGMFTEGFEGSSDICVVSASGDAFWREVNMEMLCRDIATSTLFERGWEGDASFQDWVGYYSMNTTRYSEGKRFVVIVKPTNQWREFAQRPRQVKLDKLQYHVGNAQWKELSWLSKVKSKSFEQRWSEVECTTALAFLRSYCLWTANDCRDAAHEKLMIFCGDFHNKIPGVCVAELKAAYWCWMEAFDKEVDEEVRQDACAGYTLLHELAQHGIRPPLPLAPEVPQMSVWKALLEAASHAAAPQVHAMTLQDPRLLALKEQRSIMEEQAALIETLKLQLEAATSASSSMPKTW